MDTNHPGGKHSSRVKDLVDLVVLAHPQTVDLHELQLAITAGQNLSNIEPFGHFDIPAGKVPRWSGVDRLRNCGRAARRYTGVGTDVTMAGHD